MVEKRNNKLLNFPGVCVNIWACSRVYDPEGRLGKNFVGSISQNSVVDG